METEVIVHSKNSESGTVTVLFVAMLPVLIGFAALVVDLGYMYQHKGIMQTATDAAALSGAYTLRKKDFDNVNMYALYDAEKNGFDGSRGETRTVNHPPLGGDFTTNRNFVEVIITEQIPTFFMGFFGQHTVAVSARGVAGVLSAPGCIYVLDPSADKAFEVSSGSDFIGSDCGVRVNSCSDEALSVTSGSTLDVNSIDVCGGVDDSGSTINPEPNTGVCPGEPCTTEGDPLAYLPQPSVPAGCDFTDFKTSSQGTLQIRFQIFPGTYCNGISIESGSDVNFNPGTYYLKGGGLRISSSSTAEGFGVGFYNTTWGGSNYQPITIESGSETRFSAQAGDGAGVMEGIVFWQDPTVEGEYDNSIQSGSNSWFEGTLYFPTQHLEFASNTVAESAADWSIILANTLEVSSGGSVEINSNFGEESRSPILEPVLVE